MMKTKMTVGAVLALGALTACAEAEFPREYPELPQKLTDETPEQKAERLAWWTDARFGMFIHFGLYAVPAGVGEAGATDLGEWI